MTKQEFGNKEEVGSLGAPGQATLPPDTVEYMLLYVVRNEHIFLEAKRVLAPALFNKQGEIHFRLIYATVCELYDKYQSLPSKHALDSELAAKLEEQPDLLPQSGLDELFYITSYFFEVSLEALSGQYENYGFDLLKKFVIERNAWDKLKSIVSDLGPSVHVDVSGFLLDLANRVQEAESVNREVSIGLRQTSFHEERPFRSTGLAFINTALGGGDRPKDIYGIFGPTGSGKTTLASQLVSEAGRHFYTNYNVLGKTVCAYYVSYETPGEEIQVKMVSYLARVSFRSLLCANWETGLSRRGNRKEYENTLFPMDDRGEWERYQEMAAPIDPHICVLKFNGPKEAPKAGSGWMQEINVAISKDARKYNRVPGLVLIDYAKLAAKRYIKAKGWDMNKNLRLVLSDAADDARRFIADPFDVPVWILNQMDAESQKARPGARMHHAGSSEAKDVAENMAGAFCLGNKDRTNNCVLFQWTKTRIAEGEGEGELLQITGDLSRLDPCSDKYMLDPRTRKFIQRETYGAMVAPSEADSQSSRRRQQQQTRAGSAGAL